MNLKGWFTGKLQPNERYVVNCSYRNEVIGETEKAVKVVFICTKGKVTLWIPKSAIGTDVASGPNYNRTLYLFAKENGVKGVREMMKTTTLIKKIKDAGLEIPARG